MTTTQPDAASEAQALKDLARDIERGRLLQIGSQHAVMVMGALTLWGAAEVWARSTGWGVAHFAAVANAVIAGFVLPATLHEWGHFLGARLAGAESPVFEAPKRHFFLFDFPIDKNDTRQFLWMSWGGILAPWAVVLAVLLCVPLGSTGGAALVATLVARALGTTVFEGPIALRADRSGDPGGELGKRLQEGGLARGRKVGTTVGVALFALLWLAG